MHMVESQGGDLIVLSDVVRRFELADQRPLIALDEPTLSQDATAAAAIRMVASGSSGLVISHSNVFDGLNEICLGGAI